jgi:hypothetical protein
MGLFTPKCKHVWGDPAHYFNAPTSGIKSISGATSQDADTIMRLRFGVTTVSQCCVTCGEARSYTVTGRIELPVRRVVTGGALLQYG